MMGFRAESKKAVKDAIKAGRPMSSNRLIETSMFGNEYKGDGTYTVVGPDPERNRKWFAQITIKDDKVIAIK